MKKRLIAIYSALIIGFIGIVIGPAKIEELVGARTQSDLQIGLEVGAGTANSVLFVDGSSKLNQDNANFTWNDSTDTLTATNASIGTLTISTTTSGDLSVTGNTYTAAGTAASPSHSFRTDQDTGMWVPASNSLAFSTLGAERIRILSDGNVGIGTTGPDGTLHIHTSSAGTITPNIFGDDLIVENSGDSGISLLGGTANATRIIFGDSSDNDAGMILYHLSTDYMSFTTNNTEAMRINSTGLVGIGAAPTTVFEVQGTASASYLLTGNTLQVGGYSSAAYSRFGVTGTTHIGSISTTNDLLVNGDFEVDASAAFDGFVGLFGAATTSFEMQSSSTTQGACIALKDQDGSGYTYVRANDGALIASTVSCK